MKEPFDAVDFAFPLLPPFLFLHITNLYASVADTNNNNNNKRFLIGV